MLVLHGGLLPAAELSQGGSVLSMAWGSAKALELIIMIAIDKISFCMMSTPQNDWNID